MLSFGHLMIPPLVCPYCSQRFGKHEKQLLGVTARGHQVHCRCGWANRFSAVGCWGRHRGGIDDLFSGIV